MTRAPAFVAVAALTLVTGCANASGGPGSPRSVSTGRVSASIVVIAPPTHPAQMASPQPTAPAPSTLTGLVSRLDCTSSTSPVENGAGDDGAGTGTWTTTCVRPHDQIMIQVASTADLLQKSVNLIETGPGTTAVQGDLWVAWCQCSASELAPLAGRPVGHR